MKKLLAILACLRSRWEKAKAAHASIPVTSEGNPPMAAVDLSPLAAEFEALSAYLARLAAGAQSSVQLQADLDAEKQAHAATQALLGQANTDLATSQADVAALAAKYASLVPAA